MVKTLLNITRKKKKKHNKIIALARSKLNIIENLISQTLIDFEITHEEFSKIIYENNNYEQIIDGKAIILSTCAIYGSKKSKFIKEQEAKGLLSNLGLRTPLNKIPVLGDILF